MYLEDIMRRFMSGFATFTFLLALLLQSAPLFAQQNGGNEETERLLRRNWSLFLEKGIFNQEVAGSFRKNILARGNSFHPMDLFVAFRGRKPDPDALLKRDGLI